MGKRLDGRVAIVTGAGRGIGRCVAMLLAEEGASVVVNDLGAAVDGTGVSGGPADEVASEIREAGGSAVASPNSVAEYDSAAGTVQTAIDSFGRVDILCHVAGILRDRMVFNMTEEEWDGVLRVHLYGAFNMVRNVVPHMIEQRYGRIVLFSSGSGLGASGQANYATAKEGMVGFARGLSRELSQYGVSVNAVYPGGATRMVETIPGDAPSSSGSSSGPPRPRRQRPRGPVWQRRGRPSKARRKRGRRRTTHPKPSICAPRQRAPSRARSSARADGP